MYRLEWGSSRAISRRGPRKESSKYYNKRKSKVCAVVQCAEEAMTAEGWSGRAAMDLTGSYITRVFINGFLNTIVRILRISQVCILVLKLILL